MAKLSLAIVALALAFVLSDADAARDTKPKAGLSAAVNYADALVTPLKQRVDEFVDQLLNRPDSAKGTTQIDAKAD